MLKISLLKPALKGQFPIKCMGQLDFSHVNKTKFYCEEAVKASKFHKKKTQQ